ncbi:ATP-binding protein, partial [Candidatus Poribacteria bacterium]|nr:ATP-binding protein [Candidatus Poribacteria bacterium]MBT5533706.1 ATP-binding protein [Candidatus Poribacteria bacterium]MBT7807935.1 ATP-binding protein [Candidatus Poribacteria bacterium]
MVRAWRDIIHPHPDVAAGRYAQAEFAADLASVTAGTADPEYGDPAEFFGRTFLTGGMTELLAATALRLSGRGGEPVVQLKTAFGGGKTHSMLAMYHLFGAKADAAALAGAGAVGERAGIGELPRANVAAVVGTAVRSTTPYRVNGVEVRTLWGNIAAQLGGHDGYAMLASDDQAGVSPGSDALVAVMDRFAPALILVDELVAFARNLYGVDTRPSAGSFDANMTFVQSLTEAATRAQRAVVAAAIPESSIEIGAEGEGGIEALERIEHTFGRQEAIWRPVSASEGFEVVRRRLFNAVHDEPARDEVCRAYGRFYEEHSTDFPQRVTSPEYVRRMQAAYPIHPELFDRLYQDWSTLERFQRTRGVLRLMASVIHHLWTSDDRHPLILPSSLPLDVPNVRGELLRYLDGSWEAVVDGDVDGSGSVPYEIDGKTPRFGSLSAARRVARAIFVGSAPSVKQQNRRGIDENAVRLAAVQADEDVSVFNDALRRLTDRLTHLYVGNDRYWYDTQPNLTRTKDDRAAKYVLQDGALHPELDELLRKRLEAAARQRGVFRGVHVFRDSLDIPDEGNARLVVLRPQASYAARAISDAQTSAKAILDQRGNNPRSRRNTLLFLAADRDEVANVVRDAAEFLAWDSIVTGREQLNLDAYQTRQAMAARDRGDTALKVRLNYTYRWLLVPSQVGTDTMQWEVHRVASADNPVSSAAQAAVSNEFVIGKWSPMLLQMELANHLWKDEPHLSLAEVSRCLTTYLYMSRLADESVLTSAVTEGVRSGIFGYAAGVDADGMYSGLVFEQSMLGAHLDGQSVLVKADVARQLTQEPPTSTGPIISTIGEGGTTHTGSTTQIPGTQPAPPVGPPERQSPKRFYAVKQLDAMRLGTSADEIGQEVLQHLSSLVGADARVTIEIQVDVPMGVPDSTVRTVSENCRTLQFTTFEFEDE